MLPPCFGIVARYRLAFPIALMSDPAGIHAMLNEILPDSTGTALRKHLIISGLAYIIRMAGNFSLYFRVAGKVVSELVQFRERTGLQNRASCGEMH